VEESIVDMSKSIGGYKEKNYEGVSYRNEGVYVRGT
jgi:hypothetical protein